MSQVTAMWRRLDQRVVDWALIAALIALAVVELRYGILGGSVVGNPGGLGQLWHLPAVVGTILPLRWRRRWPIGCWLTQFVFAILTLEPPVAATLDAMFIGLYSIGAYSSRRWASLLPVPLSSVLLALAFPTARSALPAWALQLLIGGALWLAGNAMRSHRLRSEALADRAERLEREQELAAQVAVADERARIARELHDVVAHGVSVMVVQAGAARRLLTQRPDRAAEALREVEVSGREALADMRRLLELLAESPDGEALAPQPGLGQLDDLVERVRAAGLPVVLHREGEARPLPAGLDLAAYRIAQEALTNALKYARGAQAQVVVKYREKALTVEVIDGGGVAMSEPPGAGRGLVGMRERAAVYGGTLEAAARPEGGFLVRASLPLEPRA